MTKEKGAENHQLGNLVARYRKAQGRSARDVAREANIDIHTMTKLEQGHYASPSPLTLKGVSKALGIPLLQLFQAAGYLTPYDLIDMAQHATKLPVFNEDQAAINERYLNELIEKHGMEFEEPNRKRRSEPEQTTT